MSKTRKSIKLICLCGVMAALYTCLDIISVSVSAPFGGNLKLSLSGFPVIIAAIAGGPLWGAATGFVGAFVGQLLGPYGLTATTLLWVLPAVARGLSIGFLFRAFGKSTRPSTLVLETVISSIIVTAFNTAAMLIDQAVYHYSSTATVLIALPGRLIAGALTAVAFALMLPSVLPPLEKHIIGEKTVKS